MIEHEPWCGPLYREPGVDGQHIAIVGYSHHHDGVDYDGLTIDVLRRWTDGERFANSLFPYVESYFDGIVQQDLWNRVLFFNYLPDCIGTGEERFNSGSKQQVERAKSRFLDIIAKHKPHKVLVFTKRGWSTFPETREEEAHTGLRRLEPKELYDFTWGTYDANGSIIGAFGLRHPQFANGQLMRQAVQCILAMPVLGG